MELTRKVIGKGSPKKRIEIEYFYIEIKLFETFLWHRLKYLLVIATKIIITSAIEFKGYK